MYVLGDQKQKIKNYPPKFDRIKIIYIIIL